MSQNNGPISRLVNQSINSVVKPKKAAPPRMAPTAADYLLGRAQVPQPPAQAPNPIANQQRQNAQTVRRMSPGIDRVANPSNERRVQIRANTPGTPENTRELVRRQVATLQVPDEMRAEVEALVDSALFIRTTYLDPETNMRRRVSPLASQNAIRQTGLLDPSDAMEVVALIKTPEGRSLLKTEVEQFRAQRGRGQAQAKELEALARPGNVDPTIAGVGAVIDQLKPVALGVPSELMSRAIQNDPANIAGAVGAGEAVVGAFQDAGLAQFRSAVQPLRMLGVDPDAIERGIRQFGQAQVRGFAGGVSSMTRIPQLLGSKEWADLSDAIDKGIAMRDADKPLDKTFFNEIGRTAGGVVAQIAPTLLTGGSSIGASVAGRMAASAVFGMTEAATNAAGGFDRAVKEGQNIEEARQRAFRAMPVDAIVSSVLNKLGAFGELSPAWKKMFASSFTEGLQETFQTGLEGYVATGELDFTSPEAIKGGLLGMILGPLMGGGIDLATGTQMEGGAEAVPPQAGLPIQRVSASAIEDAYANVPDYGGDLPEGSLVGAARWRDTETLRTAIIEDGMAPPPTQSGGSSAVNAGYAAQYKRYVDLFNRVSRSTYNVNNATIGRDTFNKEVELLRDLHIEFWREASRPQPAQRVSANTIERSYQGIDEGPELSAGALVNLAQQFAPQSQPQPAVASASQETPASRTGAPSFSEIEEGSRVESGVRIPRNRIHGTGSGITVSETGGFGRGLQRRIYLTPKQAEEYRRITLIEDHREAKQANADWLSAPEQAGVRQAIWDALNSPHFTTRVGEQFVDQYGRLVTILGPHPDDPEYALVRRPDGTTGAAEGWLLDYPEDDGGNAAQLPPPPDSTLPPTATTPDFPRTPPADMPRQQDAPQAQAQPVVTPSLAQQPPGTRGESAVVETNLQDSQARAKAISESPVPGATEAAWSSGNQQIVTGVERIQDAISRVGASPSPKEKDVVHLLTTMHKVRARAEAAGVDIDPAGELQGIEARMRDLGYEVEPGFMAPGDAYNDSSPAEVMDHIQAEGELRVHEQFSPAVFKDGNLIVKPKIITIGYSEFFDKPKDDGGNAAQLPPPPDSTLPPTATTPDFPRTPPADMPRQQEAQRMTAADISNEKGIRQQIAEHRKRAASLRAQAAELRATAKAEGRDFRNKVQYDRATKSIIPTRDLQDVEYQRLLDEANAFTRAASQLEATLPSRRGSQGEARRQKIAALTPLPRSIKTGSRVVVKLSPGAIGGVEVLPITNIDSRTVAAIGGDLLAVEPGVGIVVARDGVIVERIDAGSLSTTDILRALSSKLPAKEPSAPATTQSGDLQSPRQQEPQQEAQAFTQPAAQEVTPKEPWQMGKAEYVESIYRGYGLEPDSSSDPQYQQFEGEWEDAVRKAYAAGKPVPAENMSAVTIGVGSPVVVRGMRGEVRGASGDAYFVDYGQIGQYEPKSEVRLATPDEITAARGSFVKQPTAPLTPAVARTAEEGPGASIRTRGVDPFNTLPLHQITRKELQQNEGDTGGAKVPKSKAVLTLEAKWREAQRKVDDFVQSQILSGNRNYANNALYLKLEDASESAGRVYRLKREAEIDAAHYRAVEQALKNGLPVPPEVLADYPDLEAKYQPQPVAQTPANAPDAPSLRKVAEGVGRDTQAKIPPQPTEFVQPKEVTGRFEPVPENVARDIASRVVTKKSTFDIAKAEGRATVSGVIFTHPDDPTLAFGVYKDGPSRYGVSELSTGRYAAQGSTENDAILALSRVPLARIQAVVGREVTDAGTPEALQAKARELEQAEAEKTDGWKATRAKARQAHLDSLPTDEAKNLAKDRFAQTDFAREAAIPSIRNWIDNASENDIAKFLTGTKASAETLTGVKFSSAQSFARNKEYEDAKAYAGALWSETRGKFGRYFEVSESDIRPHNFAKDDRQMLGSEPIDGHEWWSNTHVATRGVPRGANAAADKTPNMSRIIPKPGAERVTVVGHVIDSALGVKHPFTVMSNGARFNSAYFMGLMKHNPNVAYFEQSDINRTLAAYDSNGDAIWVIMPFQQDADMVEFLKSKRSTAQPQESARPQPATTPKPELAPDTARMQAQKQEATKARQSSREESARRKSAEGFAALPERSRAEFDKRMASNSVDDIASMLHPSNKSFRAEFERRTGVTLPSTVSGTKQAVANWVQAQSQNTPAKAPESVSPGVRQAEGSTAGVADAVAAEIDEWASKAKPASASKGVTPGKTMASKDGRYWTDTFIGMVIPQGRKLLAPMEPTHTSKDLDFNKVMGYGPQAGEGIELQRLGEMNGKAIYDGGRLWVLDRHKIALIEKYHGNVTLRAHVTHRDAISAFNSKGQKVAVIASGNSAPQDFPGTDWDSIADVLRARVAESGVKASNPAGVAETTAQKQPKPRTQAQQRADAKKRDAALQDLVYGTPGTVIEKRLFTDTVVSYDKKQNTVVVSRTENGRNMGQFPLIGGLDKRDVVSITAPDGTVLYGNRKLTDAAKERVEAMLAPKQAKKPAPQSPAEPKVAKAAKPVVVPAFPSVNNFRKTDLQKIKAYFGTKAFTRLEDAVTSAANAEAREQAWLNFLMEDPLHNHMAGLIRRYTLNQGNVALLPSEFEERARSISAVDGVDSPDWVRAFNKVGRYDANPQAYWNAHNNMAVAMGMPELVVTRKQAQQANPQSPAEPKVVAKTPQRLRYNEIIAEYAKSRGASVFDGNSPTGRIAAQDAFKQVQKEFSWVRNFGDLDRQSPDILASPSKPAKSKGTITVDGKERPRTNSNGQPIHPTEEGIRAFWQWFGESKIVDEQGRPLVVYHGTAKAFTQVNFKKGAQGLFWFSSSQDAITSGLAAAKATDTLMPLYVKSDKPATWTQYKSLTMHELKRNGFDGAILDHDGYFDGFVFASPTQIKSAIGNQGTFSPDNPSILASPRRVRRGMAPEPIKWEVAALPYDGPAIPLSDLRIDLEQAFGKLRTGTSAKGTKGVYVISPDIKYVRYGNDVVTAAHEIAHQLDARQGITNNIAGPALDQLRSGFFDRTIPENASQEVADMERFAVLVEAYVSDPERLKALTPELFGWMEKILPTKSLTALQNFSTKLRQYAGQSATAKASSSFVMGRQVNPVQRTVENIKAGSVERFTDNLTQGWLDQYGALLRSVDRIIGGGDRKEGARKRKENPLMDWEVALRDVPYTDEMFTAQMQEGFIDRRLSEQTGSIVTAPSFVQLVSHLEPGTDKFEENYRKATAYMNALRHLDWADRKKSEAEANIEAYIDAVNEVKDMAIAQKRLDLMTKAVENGASNIELAIKPELDAYTKRINAIAKGKITRFSNAERKHAIRMGEESGLVAMGPGIKSTVEEARRALKELEPDMKMLRAFEKDYRALSDYNLNMLVWGGRLTPDQAATIRANNPHWFAVIRIDDREATLEEVVRAHLRPTRSIFGARNLVHSFQGSQRTKDDPLAALATRMRDVMQESHRNRALAQMTYLLKNAGFADGMEGELNRVRLEDGIAPTENQFTIWVNGEKQVWEVSKENSAVLQSMRAISMQSEDGKTLEAMLRVLSKPASITRNLIINAPPFIVRNLTRDTIHRMTMVENFGPGAKVPKQSGLAESMGVGLGRSTVFEDPDSFVRRQKDALDDLTSKGHIVLRGRRAYQNLRESAEMVNRKVVFDQAYRAFRASGYNEYQATTLAAYAARESMTDFKRIGSKARALSQIIPFFSAQIAGTSTSMRQLGKNPAQVIKKLTVYSAVLMGLEQLWAALGGDDEEKELERLNNLDRYQRELFWNFRVGGDDGFWLSIPKGHEQSIYTTMVGQLAASLNEGRFGTPDSKRVPRAFVDNLLPVSTLPDAFGGWLPLVELLFNKKTFNDREIVPDYERNKEMSRRNIQYASPIGKALHGFLGVDARQWDYALEEMTGYYGRAITGMAEAENPDDAGRILLRFTGLNMPGSPTQNENVIAVDNLLRTFGKRPTGWESMKKAFFNAKTEAERQRAGRALVNRAKIVRERLEAWKPLPDEARKANVDLLFP